MGKRRFYPFDVIILSYVLLLTLLILIFGRPLNMYYDELIINLGIVILVIAVVRFLHVPSSRTAMLFRLLYPALLFTIFYEQTSGMMQLLFPEFFDSQLTGFEKSVLGFNPTLWLDRNLINVWLTEILSFFYVSYYPLIPVFLIPLYFMKRFDILKPALTAICLAYFMSYLLFLLYPIEGPRYYFAAQYASDITGPIFRPLVELIQAEAAVHGGCMPSSHVAVAIVIMIFCLKYFKKVGILVVMMNIGMTLGAIYGRYHYISDAVAGALIGVCASCLVLKYFGGTAKDEEDIKRSGEKELRYVS
jgi:membrane-associated phospholipid phosphatase